MKKRILILILPVLIFTLLLLFAGCTPKAPPSASPSPSPSTAPSPTASPSAEPSPTPSLIVDPPPPPSPSESAAPSIKPSPSPDNNGESDFSSPGYALMENDGLGAIQYRMTESALLALLGEPESRSETLNWGADGLDHTQWYYPSKGLELGMVQLPDDVEASVFSIKAAAPCDLATQRGIKLGATYDDVIKAYAKEFNDDESGKNGIVLGTVYGGIIMNLENGVVTSIFIGAAAE